MRGTKSKRIPEHYNKLIFEFYSNGRRHGRTYKELADDFNSQFATDFPESSLRGRFQEYELKLEDGELPLPPEETEVLEDGTVIIKNVTKMRPEDAMTPDYILEDKGYDPTKWTVVKYKTSNWGSIDPTSPFQNYSVGLEIKPKDESKISLEAMVKVNKDYKYVHESVPVKYVDHNDNTGKALEVALPDIHIGSSSSNVRIIKELVEEIAEFAEQTNVTKIYLTFLGDILHVDNTNKTTVRLTQLELEDTFEEMWKKAKDLLNYIVHTFSLFETEVIWVSGNHSRGLEYALFDGLKDTWEANTQITFDVDMKLRKVFQYGLNGVGLTHGDMPKKQLFDWFAADFPEVWGKIKYREMHYGHLHSEAVDTIGGVINRRIGTTKSQDEFEYFMGFPETPCVIQTFLYDKKRGMRQSNYWVY